MVLTVLALARLGKFVFVLLTCVLVVTAAEFAWKGWQDAFPHTFYHMAINPVGFPAHVVFSPIATALVPLQFWAWFRRRFTTLHRILGVVTVISVILGGTSAALIGLDAHYGTFGQIGFFVGGVLWVVSAIAALIHALRRNRQAHKTWVVVLAALTFAVATFRIQLPVFDVVFGMPTNDSVALAAWTGWLFNLAMLAVWNARRLSMGRVRFV